MMDKQKVVHILQTAPYADLIEFLLGRCNLSEKERRMINDRAKEEITQEEYAEKIGKSTRYVQIHEDRAYQKIIENWSQLEFLDHL